MNSRGDHMRLLAKMLALQNEELAAATRIQIVVDQMMVDDDPVPELRSRVITILYLTHERGSRLIARIRNLGSSMLCIPSVHDYAHKPNATRISDEVQIGRAVALRYGEAATSARSLGDQSSAWILDRGVSEVADHADQCERLARDLALT